MALVYCTKHVRKGDTSLFCFEDAAGTHHSPRECRCLMVKADDGTWSPWSPDADQKRRYTSAVMPNDEFKAQMTKKFGKQNPDCPIGDAHSPIDPRLVAR
jgi:hypothetical protein